MDQRANARMHHKITDILDMDITAESEESDPMVPLPNSTEITVVDNPELPALQDEFLHLEHGRRQTEYMLDKGMAAVEQALQELELLPPMYKPKAYMAVAELFSAVSTLKQHKDDREIRLIELKMKMAAFTRNKSGNNNITGNTFIINREELIKAYSETETGDD